MRASSIKPVHVPSLSQSSNITLNIQMVPFEHSLPIFNINTTGIPIVSYMSRA